MATSTDTKVASSYTKTIYVIDPYQTTNATQATADSFFLGTNKSAYVHVVYTCTNSIYTAVAGGTAEALFIRAGGNIARSNVSDSKGLLTTIFGNFGVVNPSVNIVANTGTQSIDVKVTGQLATTINRHLEVTILMSND